MVPGLGVNFQLQLYVKKMCVKLYVVFCKLADLIKPVYIFGCEIHAVVTGIL